MSTEKNQQKITVDFTKSDLQVTLNRNDLFSIFSSIKMLKMGVSDKVANESFVKDIETIIYERAEQQQQQQQKEEQLEKEDMTKKLLNQSE